MRGLWGAGPAARMRGVWGGGVGSGEAGLVPKQSHPGGADRPGRRSRSGPSLLRKMLVEAGWVLLRYNAWAQRLMQRLSRGQKTRRKQSIVALARKLLVALWKYVTAGVVTEGAAMTAA